MSKARFYLSLAFARKYHFLVILSAIFIFLIVIKVVKSQKNYRKSNIMGCYLYILVEI